VSFDQEGVAEGTDDSIQVSQLDADQSRAIRRGPRGKEIKMGYIGGYRAIRLDHLVIVAGRFKIDPPPVVSRIGSRRKEGRIDIRSARSQIADVRQNVSGLAGAIGFHGGVHRATAIVDGAGRCGRAGRS